MHGLSVKCFGVGDGTASAERNHSSYLYDFGAATVLIDCGESVSRSYKASGSSYEKVDRIILSHLHSDHIGGFFMLIQGFWLEGRKRELRVHMPADGIEPIRKFLRMAYLFDEILTFPIIFEPLQVGKPIIITDQVRIDCFPTTHLENFRQRFQAKYPAEYAAFSFLIETASGRIVHSADIGAPQDLDPLLEQPVELLVCELAHFKREELFQYLKGRDIKKIAIVHIARWFWERMDETRAIATKMLPGMNIVYPRDQEVLTL